MRHVFHVISCLLAFPETDVLSDWRPRIFGAPFERLVSQPNDTVGVDDLKCAMIILPRLDRIGPGMMESMPDPSIFTGELRRGSFGGHITAKRQSWAGNTEITLPVASSSSAIDDADLVDLAGVPQNPVGDTRSLR
ncbi:MULTISPECIES: hypothetical protein [Bradyrhizobium]